MASWSIKTHTITLMFLCALTAQAQQTATPLSPGYDRAVANEDGGQAFIIEPSSRRLSSFGRPRKGTIAEPEQYSIFVGRQWQTSALRERQVKLQSLLANLADEAELLALQEIGIRNRFAPTRTVERPDVESRSLSDLDIQRLLAAMFESGALPRPSGNRIYLVFLDPEIESTLGLLTGGKHYVAYHNAFRAGGAHTRYVVIPFQSDPARAAHDALRSFVAAAVKPAHFAK
jgi:hypothetical protein